MPDIETIVARLREKYPDATYELRWETPFQLLIATILVAQAADERINAVTATLFEKYPDAQAFTDTARGLAPSRKRPEGPIMKLDQIPESWKEVLADEFAKPYFKKLEEFVDAERQKHTIFPPEDQVFSALEATPYDRVRVMILGQDPYHDVGQAHGMCFSVRPGVPRPPSLVNIFKELHTDLGCKMPNNGYLMPWAKQGVLLLNAVLTVQAHEANSHKDKGWERFTDAIITAVGRKEDPVVFLLWGAAAQKKEKLIDTERHTVLKAAHPSPLSMKKFFGSKPFSSANKALRSAGEGEIDWQIPDI